MLNRYIQSIQRNPSAISTSLTKPYQYRAQYINHKITHKLNGDRKAETSGKKTANDFTAIPAAMPYQQHPMTQISSRLVAALKPH